MDWVRPGLELVRAIFVPSSEFSTLDLPTLERPRNATSGVAGTGNWSTPVAALMNLDRTRTLQFRVSAEKLQVATSGSVEAQRALVLNVLIADWKVLVTQIKERRNCQTETNANCEELAEEHPVCGERHDKEHGDS